MYTAASQPVKAERALRAAIDADPRFQPAYTLLAQLYFDQKRFDEARGEFERLVARDPKAVAPRTMIGVILEAQNKRGEAKAWYEATLKIVDDAPVVANNLAFIYAEEGTNLDMALQLASSAKQRLPNIAEVDDTLGWVYYKKDMASLAVAPLEASVRQNPQRPDFLYHLGVTYARLGEKAKAQQVLGRALQLDPAFQGADVARATLATVAR
jgi:tetratricopeptide (TPR) repeat protein